jgi:hypothetical protein
VVAYSAEQSFPAEQPQHEHLNSLGFDELKTGDQLLLYFEDGRAYWLGIDYQDKEGNNFARAIFGRKSQFATEIENWEEHPHRLQLKGICDRVRVEDDKVTVVAGTPGVFQAGKHAWFEFMSERGEKPLLSPFPIKMIKLERQTRPENNVAATENLVL